MENIAISALLNEREAARRLGLSVTTLRRWRWAGRPPNYVKIGSAVRYEPSEIESLIDTGRRTSTSDHRPNTAAS
jgi:predicted DNA-binding transcriptional regulator AlpA